MRLFQHSNVRVLVSVLSAILLALPAVTAFALVNAYKYQSVSNKGAYSAIVTGNPTIRTDPSGRWSYMRVAVQRIISGNVYYAEVGWIKGAQPQSNFIPRSYWTYRDTSGNTDVGWGGYPGIGIGYNYEVKRTATNTWSFYFNDLGTPLHTQTVGWENADDIFSGGEVPSSLQGMGDSNNNNVQYLNSAGTTWFGACSTTVTNDDPTKYHVDAGGNCSSWRVYGNN